MGEKIDLAVPFGFCVVLCLNWCPTKDYSEFSIVAKGCEIRVRIGKVWYLLNIVVFTFVSTFFKTLYLFNLFIEFYNYISVRLGIYLL